jgi:Protein of unknown function (DUF4054)
MAITAADVTNLAPELSSVSEPRMAWALAIANARLSDSVLTTAITELARAYYAAHLLTVGALTGSVTSESAGGVSRSYKQADNPLDATGYGQEYRRLLRGHAGRAGLVA